MRSADQLRNLIFAQGVEERVEVNQRHLIDKILARYRYINEEHIAIHWKDIPFL